MGQALHKCHTCLYTSVTRHGSSVTQVPHILHKRYPTEVKRYTSLYTSVTRHGSSVTIVPHMLHKRYPTDVKRYTSVTHVHTQALPDRGEALHKCHTCASRGDLGGARRRWRRQHGRRVFSSRPGAGTCSIARSCQCRAVRLGPVTVRPVGSGPHAANV
jgi:hypothetical protein